jgi:hypothetical protein
MPDGMPASSVEVILSSSVMQGNRTTTTGTTGRYVFTSLAPGAYTVEFRSRGSEVARRLEQVPLGGEVAVDVRLQLAGQEALVIVVAEAVATSTVGSNFTSDEVERLPMLRTPTSIGRFAPGVSDAVQTPGPTEGQGQLIISGGLGYDNLIMSNGVDIGDNIFGHPQNLFIEDAIAETQVLTGGIPAEFGRFGGGVLNFTTKNGGNRWSGSYRMNLGNDAWSVETPFETSNSVTRVSHVNLVHEGTLGGPAVKDRVWFFLAGRVSRQQTTPTLPVTATPYETTDRNTRGEAKVTATLVPGHRVQGSVLGNPRQQTNQANFTGTVATIDPFALSDKHRPNHLIGVTYQGVAAPELLVDAQYSQQQFQTDLGGGASTSLVDSPFFSTDLRQQYNAPYFDLTDPDRRNNRQLTGSVLYFRGGHELKVGGEFFRSQKIGGNSQSATGYVFQADYLADAAGRPILDPSGRIVPLFAAGVTAVSRYDATRGATLNIDELSGYAQDHWVVSPHVSLDLGVRIEHVVSDATGASQDVNATRAVPRLGAAYDPRGDGSYVVRGTFGQYASRYNDGLFLSNSAVGNPNELDGVYVGPSGQGRGFAEGFNIANYDFDHASYPTANVFYDPALSSPLTTEFTASFARDIYQRGSFEVNYVWRRTARIVEDFIDLSNGTTHVVDGGVDLTLTNRLFANTELAERRYQALLFQGHYVVRQGWSVNGHLTVQLANDGNYEGEAPSRIVTSAIGDYPEIFTESWHYPTGRLASFQRSKLHLWSVYDLDFGKAGSGWVSGLWRYNSARTYALKAVNRSLTAAQLGILTGLGYPDAPASQTLFYSLPGSESFAGYGIVDVSAGYDVPVFQSIRPRFEVEVYNVFNNQKAISWNTSITPDAASPKDSLGIPSGYVKGASFGKATNNLNFPVPFAGQTGGRTVRLTLGVRF